MSDYAINLLKAIESGNEEDMNLSFSNAMANKISDALDAKKIEVAQKIYGFNQTDNSSETLEISSGDDSVESNIDTTETSTENDVKEV